MQSQVPLAPRQLSARTSRPFRSAAQTVLPVRMYTRRRSLPAMLISVTSFSFVSLVFFASYVNQIATVERHGQFVDNHAARQIVDSRRDVAGCSDLGNRCTALPANLTAEHRKRENKRTPTGIVCPELGLSNLIQNKTLDLNDLKMNQSEAYIFGKQRHQVGEIVKEGNRKMGELLNKTQRHNESGRGLIMDRLSSLAIEIGNYTYLPGGHWKPSTCLPRWKVAIIFPFRNRSYHLPIVLRYLTPMLQKQLLEFAFYVINQGNDLAFNRAMLLNVGFVEALNFSKWDCFIFHDVDHVPISDFNYYGCSGMPRHFISGVDRWEYKLPYPTFFGGVTGFTTANIRKINGFPNVYWGWGGEDDELWKRVKEGKLPISRPIGPTGYYSVIKHHHVREQPMKERLTLLKSFKPRIEHDGLSNLRYTRPFLQLGNLYTNISVNIQKLKLDPRLTPKTVQTKKKGNPPKVASPKGSTGSTLTKAKPPHAARPKFNQSSEFQKRRVAQPDKNKD